ncbi:HNH endonuclease [Pseudomonas phage phiKZ]|uniref:PHIKZ056 n=1 Tax=Pseudomonas phage phiKZ TaxID=2905945 RepID=Q8SDA6_BPDPK|nr:HNH endonuclease [Pseudomonas phage phiKZ]AAL82957.1 PHIKZ056 [Pseudomonas phage phiKZ]
MEQNGVVSVFDPASFKIEWRDIPGYSAYEASNLGTIRHKRLNRICNFFLTKTSIGTYLNIGAKNDEKTSKSKGVHILICLAFHGPSPGPNYEVNHKDGNKHNNLPSNLEWMTRGENIEHAYKNGLRKENRRVIATDVTTGEKTTYYSMSELARALGVNKNTVWVIIRDHKTKPYRNRFTFEFITGETKIADRDSTKTVYVLDYKTKTLHVFHNLAEMELALGTKRNKAYYHLVRGSKEIMDGLVFSYTANPEDFPKYTQKEIEASFGKPSNGKGTPIEVTDTILNTTKVYPSIPHFARDVGIKHPNTVRRAIFEKNGVLDKYLIKLIKSSSPNE